MAGDLENEVNRVEEDPDGDEPEEEPEQVAEEGEAESEEAGEEGGEDEGEEEEEDDDEDDEEEEEEEDLIDPADAIRETCANSSECRKLREKFDQCEERVSSRKRTEENCAEELLDFLHCQDSCMAKSIFSKLK